MNDLRLKLLDPHSHQGSIFRHICPFSASHPPDILSQRDLVVVVCIDPLKEAVSGAGRGRGIVALFFRIGTTAAALSRDQKTWHLSFVGVGFGG